MVTQRTDTLSLEELLVEAVRLVEAYGFLEAQQDNRVSALPDIRTIRYYTSLGLLDRPIIEGRQGRYTVKHLLQILAIKAMQTLSLPLSDIQSKLYGLTESELEAVVAAVAEETSHKRTKEGVCPVVWREIVIEPGLKIVAEDSWIQAADSATIEARIRAALKILSAKPRKSNGGSSHE